jgi:PIN domain nuclease of toxin-antitoxin system
LRILLDTHCWLWLLVAPERLKEESRRLLASEESDLLLSAASAWEIAIKVSIGRLRLPGDPADLVPAWLVESRTSPLPIEHRHALRVATLPPHHRDPFDRLLVAQAQLEKLPIMTADEQLASYDVELLSA